VCVGCRAASKDEKTTKNHGARNKHFQVPRRFVSGLIINRVHYFVILLFEID